MQTLKIGNLSVAPVLLAPMAGVTNPPFREIVSNFYPNALLTTEMINSFAILQKNPKTLKMISFFEGEKYRSVQIFGTDPSIMSEAAAKLIGNFGVHHIDINFGCPAPKITRKGGGCILPYNQSLYKEIIRKVVNAAASVPVTAKFRIGIDDTHQTYLKAGEIAEGEGASAVTLHARTGVQYYSGSASWEYIQKLKASLKIPVIGNGDIFSKASAEKMLSETKCDGIAVGRGVMGSPWLLGQIDNSEASVPNLLSEVISVMLNHLRLSIAYFQNEEFAIKDFRKHISWYLKGFDVGSEIRNSIMKLTTEVEICKLLGSLDQNAVRDSKLPDNARVRKGLAKARLHMPDGYLEKHAENW